jgi:hypothetical protein
VGAAKTGAPVVWTLLLLVTVSPALRPTYHPHQIRTGSGDAGSSNAGGGLTAISAANYGRTDKCSQRSYSNEFIFI